MMCHSSRMNSTIQKCLSPCVSPREGVRSDAALGVTGKCPLRQGQTWLVYQERALRFQGFQLVLLQASSSLAKVLFSAMWWCFWPKVRRVLPKEDRVASPGNSVQVQLPFGAKLQVSAALLFPRGSFKLG